MSEFGDWLVYVFPYVAVPVLFVQLVRFLHYGTRYFRQNLTPQNRKLFTFVHKLNETEIGERQR